MPSRLPPENPDFKTHRENLRVALCVAPAEDFKKIFNSVEKNLQGPGDQERFTALCAHFLSVAADLNNLELFDYIWTTKFNRNSDLYLPLHTCATAGHEDLFCHIVANTSKLRLTQIDDNHRERFFYDILRSGSVKMAKAFLPYVCPADNSSAFLREAARHRNYSLVEILLPVSDLDSALRCMRTEKNSSAWVIFLEGIVNARDTKKLLQENIEQKNTPKKILKM